MVCMQMAIIFSYNKEDAKNDLPRQAGDPDNVGGGLRIAILIAGLWAMVCCFWGLRGLRTRPGRPLPFGNESHSTLWASMSKLGFRRTLMTVRMLRAQSPELLKLMLGSDLLNHRQRHGGDVLCGVRAARVER